MTDKSLVIEFLGSEFHQKLLRNSYASLVERVASNGYFPESLTGAYRGMFPRTIGALARLFLSMDQPDPVERLLRYCFRAMSEFELERVPHVIVPEDGNEKISRVDDIDQIDGQAHVILAWALLALSDDHTAFVKETYGFVSTLMARSSTAPYLSSCTHWRIEPGLVLNTHLEHSRERQYWHAYDFLTQSFMAAALEAMYDVAVRLNDKDRARIWDARLQALQANINTSMVRDLDGQRVYAEMLLPTGREPSVFPGLSWLNLAPVAADWHGVDGTVLSQTVDAWHERSSIIWRDLCLTASDWFPGQRGTEIYTKVLGWDMVYSARRSKWNQVAGVLAFLEQVNGEELPSEAFIFNTEEETWDLRDRGNGEQLAWLCWGLAECRKLVGLSPLPTC